jgi:O-antigen/teichoic acid export membrane protein
MNKKRIITDISLNILSSVFPVLFLQFLILPSIASKINANSYGELLTIVGLMSLSSGTLGNILNNSRLIHYKSYEELKLKGDYIQLLGIFLLINTCIMFLGLWYYVESRSLINIFFIILTSTFLFLRGYGRVEFRIKLNFKYILIESIYLMIGYGIGLLLFLITGYWQFIYLFGFSISFFYVFCKTDILREPFKRTELFRFTATQTLFLLISGLLLGIATYIDRLLLYPALGGVAVTIYYISTILGKTISLVIQPISGVFLSYLAHKKKVNNKSVYVMLCVSLLIGSLGYVITILISKPLLTLLYPQYVIEALNYIHVTTLTIIITIISDMLSPLVLKFCDLKWQIVINGTYLSVLIFLSLFLLDSYGLMGFCVGLLIASIIKLLSMIVIYYFLNIRTNIKGIETL